MLTYVKSEKGARTHPLLPLRDCTHCFPRVSSDRPLIVEGLARLRSCSCIIAFDLIELNGDDLRRDPLQVRKAALTSTLAKAGPGIRFNEHLECDDGEIVFRHACKVGLEGIVSKRKTSAYRSGRSSDWVKMKNPACAAVKREAEEDWGNGRG
jgi:hypothetical protein